MMKFPTEWKNNPFIFQTTNQETYWDTFPRQKKTTLSAADVIFVDAAQKHGIRSFQDQMDPRRRP